MNAKALSFPYFLVMIVTSEPSVQPQNRFRNMAHDALFNKVHGDNLVYNTCWEDPRLDLEMLKLQAESRVVMITSAGCNALDYLLAGPAEIHSVDMNHRQNALLELKLALIRHDHFEDLFAVFGQGTHPEFRPLLHQLRQQMSGDAHDYWQKKAHYFQNTPFNSSFYFRGTAGRIAWIARQSFQSNKAVRHYFASLLEARSLTEQVALYETVKPALWNKLVSWIIQQPLAMAMLGVPRAQIRLIESQWPGGLIGYIKDKLEYVLTRVPFWDNYFWRVYLTGSYTRECCPRYLQTANQALLQSRSNRIKTHSTTIANFLRENPAAYSHYVLLDHQDWLAAHKPQALAEEWELILENSRPGTRILMRSASPVISFLPAFALQRLSLEPDLSDSLHQLDRVGTYGCTLLAEVQS
jgi:S-adenosylmethionine-diacylglycerol 3-amino-3-carboxypropyl transferase